MWKPSIAHSTADAKVARASHETDDTCIENLPLGRLRAYFPHKPRPFQAHALFQASAEGMSDGRNITRNEQKDGSTDWFQAPVFLFLLLSRREIALAGISLIHHPIGRVIAFLQDIFQIALTIEHLAAQQDIRQDAVVTVLLQGTAADLQNLRDLLVRQVSLAVKHRAIITRHLLVKRKHFLHAFQRIPDTSVMRHDQLIHRHCVLSSYTWTSSSPQQR